MAGVFFLKKKRNFIAFLVVVFLLSSLSFANAFTSKDPFIKEQTYLDAIHAVPTTTGAETVVAVLDAGFDLNHEDLQGRYWKNKNETVNDRKDNDHNGYDDDVNGWDFVGNDNDPSPDLSQGGSDSVISHGTLMAGIIAANTNNGIGIAGIVPHVKIMPLRILDSRGKGNTNDVREAIEYAVNNGASVINISFTSTKPDEKLQQTIDWAMKQGVVVVAAVGNEGIDTSKTPVYPACYKGSQDNKVIGVGSVDENNKRASFSNFGKTCVDVAAPGTGIFGLVYHNENDFLYITSYGSPWEGTSMSAPMVSAVAAELKSLYPSLTPAKIRSAIMLSASPITGTVSEKVELGAGILNMAQAISIASQLASGPIIDRINATPSNLIAVSEGVGTEPLVKLFDANGNLKSVFFAYAKGFKGGVNVALGDINGDGKDEVVTVPGKGGGPHVRIFDQSGKLLGQFFAFDTWTRNGLFVSVGDVNNDGTDEIVLTQETGGTGQVRVFNQKGYLLSSLYPFGRTSVPMHVAIGNLDDDTAQEIAVTLGGKQKTNRVKVFDGNGKYVRDFSALDKIVSGLYVACGDVDGDGKDDIVVSADTGSRPWVAVYTQNGEMLSSNLVYDQKYMGGVSIAVGDVDQKNGAEIITVPLSKGGPHVRVFGSQLNAQSGFFAFDQKERFGVRVGVWNP